MKTYKTMRTKEEMKPNEAFNSVQIGNYEITNCTAIVYGERLSGIWVHALDDEFGDGDGIIFDISVSDLFQFDPTPEQQEERIEDLLINNDIERYYEITNTCEFEVIGEVKENDKVIK